MRRAVDLLVAVGCLVIFAPLIVFIAVLIRLDSRGTILYSPRMVGHRGKVFSLFRFRTMSRQPADPNPEQRLTRIGRLIREYSLDHLPMLVNLLRGDLTLVGPRPMETSVVNMQDPVWQEYFAAKPGLFNYAVLKLGRLWTPARSTNPTLNQELELEYLQARSRLSDLKLFINSIRVFLVSGGNIKARGKPDMELKNKVLP